MSRNGFSLIEATIILAIVGLVIGGIWVAASAVRDHWKTQKIAEDVIRIGMSGAKLFREEILMNADETTIHWLTSAALNAGVFPEDFRISPLTTLYAVSPEGVEFALTYTSSSRIAVRLYESAQFSIYDCTRTVRVFGSLAYRLNLTTNIQIGETTTATPESYTCSSGFNRVVFWFKL
jgi:hypothetical protein